jgi:hypothetical protein
MVVSLLAEVPTPRTGNRTHDDYPDVIATPRCVARDSVALYLVLALTASECVIRPEKLVFFLGALRNAGHLKRRVSEGFLQDATRRHGDVLLSWNCLVILSSA